MLCSTEEGKERGKGGRGDREGDVERESRELKVARGMGDWEVLLVKIP